MSPVSHLPITAEGHSITCLDCPQEKDHKFVFVLSPATEGTFTWLTSCGDDLNPTPPASGRGDGAQALLTFTEPDTKEIEVQFCEPVELHAGHVSWREVANWGFEDNWSLSIRLPATTAVENQGNTGNCNLVDTGMGFNLIVPADGDGTHDIDYDQAVPVPDGYNTQTQQGTGFWDVDQHWTEAITPNVDEKGEYNFYDTALEIFFVKHLDCGSALGIWEFAGYKAEWISKKWKLCFAATRATSGAGKIGGYFVMFRPGAT